MQDEPRGNDSSKLNFGKLSIQNLVTTLQDALASRNQDRFEAVLQEIKQRGEVNQSLLVATEKGYLEAINTLLEHGADIEVTSPNYDGWTPLGIAIILNNAEVMSLFVKRGANVEASNSDGEITLLGLAALSRKAEVINLLLDHGAKIEATDKNGDTALSEAAVTYYDNADCIKALIQRGANIEATNLKGWTPLRRATENKCIKNIKALLENGTQPAIDENGNTPFHLYIIEGNEEAGVLSLIALNNLLKTTHIGLEVKNNQGKTPLMLAIEKDNIEMVRILLKNNADIYVKDSSGESLFDACQKGKYSKDVSKAINDHNLIAGRSLRAKEFEESDLGKQLPRDVRRLVHGYSGYKDNIKAIDDDVSKKASTAKNQSKKPGQS